MIHLEDLDTDKDEHLARLAHSVRTPYQKALMRSPEFADNLYALAMRNLGELAVAPVVLEGQEPLGHRQLLPYLINLAQERFAHYHPNMPSDELAIAHAALVYITCHENFDTDLNTL